MARSGMGPPSAWMNSAHGIHVHIYIYNLQNFYVIDPKLINKITKFILISQAWPISSVSPLGFHIKKREREKKIEKAYVYSQE